MRTTACWAEAGVRSRRTRRSSAAASSARAQKTTQCQAFTESRPLMIYSAERASFSNSYSCASQTGPRGLEKADSPLRRRALLIAYHNDGSRSRESPSPSPGTPAPHGKDIPVDSLSAASSQCITRLPAPCYEPSTKALNLMPNLVAVHAAVLLLESASKDA